MKTYIIIKEYFKVLIEAYDWNFAKNSAYKRLFPYPHTDKAPDIGDTFNHFDRIVISEDEVVYGEYHNGQKVLIAITPFILDKLRRFIDLKTCF